MFSAFWLCWICHVCLQWGFLYRQTISFCAYDNLLLLHFIICVCVWRGRGDHIFDKEGPNFVLKSEQFEGIPPDQKWFVISCTNKSDVVLVDITVHTEWGSSLVSFFFFFFLNNFKWCKWILNMECLNKFIIGWVHAVFIWMKIKKRDMDKSILIQM